MAMLIFGLLAVWPLPTAALAALPAASPAGMAAHGGLVAVEQGKVYELVVGPERLALYRAPLGSEAQPVAPAGEQVTLFCAGHDPVSLEATSDHFEAPNLYGVEQALTLAAVVQGAKGAAAVRFSFRPEAASSFHDHRPYHGGMVGMVGERHLELALVPIGSGSAVSAKRGGPQVELQVYVSDAYRQPIPLEGLSAEVRLGEGASRPLSPSAGSFVTRFPKPSGPLDAHVEVHFPGESEPVSMDFYLAETTAQAADPSSPIEIRVGGAGFSPARVEAPTGQPVTLRFLRTTDQTCATQVIFPALGITRPLPLHQPVEVKLVARHGALAFSCGMRMFKGSVVGQ